MTTRLLTKVASEVSRA